MKAKLITLGVLILLLIPTSIYASRKIQWQIPKDKTQKDYNYDIYTCMGEGHDLLDSFALGLRPFIVGLPTLKAGDVSIRCRERVVKCMERKGYGITENDKYYYIYSDPYKDNKEQ